MKLRSFVLAGLVACGLMVAVGYSYAACPSWVTHSGCPTCTCEGPLTMLQMFESDNNGNWTFNSTFRQQLTDWLSQTQGPAFNEQDWIPKKGLYLAPNTNWGQDQLHVIYKEAGVATRAYMQLPRLDTVYPEIYRWTLGGSFNALWINWAPPEGCIPPWSPQTCEGDPDPGATNPCCRPWTKPNMTQRIPGATKSFDEIESVCWYQNGVQKACVDHSRPDLFFTIKESRMPINYDFQKPATGYNPSNYSPTKQQYAYWTIPNPWFRVQGLPIMFAYFSTTGLVPDPNIPSTLVIRTGGVDYAINILGGDVDVSEPPLIPTTTQVTGNEVNKGKGKVKNKEIAVSTANILASEVETVDGKNLVIQWGEAVLLEPYWQVMAVIGNSCAVGNQLVLSCTPDTMVYASVEVPQPAGAAVLPAPAWSALKDAIRAKGESSARISIYYRRFYQNAVPDGGVLQVRSQSDYIEFPF